MLGDLRILDTGDELLLDTERVALQALFDLIRRFKIGFDVELHKRTLERGLLSLVGPPTRRARRRRPGGRARQRVDRDRRRPRAADRTDVGIDVAVRRRRDRRGVCAALVAAGARRSTRTPPRSLRVERGRPRYGVDLDDSTIPQEAGLNERAVSFTKGCYVGQETVARLFYKGKPNRHLRGLRLSGAGARRARRCVLGDREVGRVGSVVVSPALGPIALALVRREAEPGDDARGRRRRHRRASSSCRSAEAAAVGGTPRAARASCACSSGSSRASWDASHVETIRTSSTSSGGSQPVAPRPSPRAQRRRGARLQVVDGRVSGPQSTTRPPTSQNASARSPSRVRGERRAAGARASPRSSAAEPLEQDAQPRVAAAQPRRALEALLVGRARASGASTWASSARAAVAACR